MNILAMKMTEAVVQREPEFEQLEKLFRPFIFFVGGGGGASGIKPDGLKEKKVILRAATCARDFAMISSSTSPVHFPCYCQKEIKPYVSIVLALL